MHKRNGIEFVFTFLAVEVRDDLLAQLTMLCNFLPDEHHELCLYVFAALAIIIV